MDPSLPVVIFVRVLVSKGLSWSEVDTFNLIGEEGGGKGTCGINQFKLSRKKGGKNQVLDISKEHSVELWKHLTNPSVKWIQFLWRSMADLKKTEFLNSVKIYRIYEYVFTSINMYQTTVLDIRILPCVRYWVKVTVDVSMLPAV